MIAALTTTGALAVALCVTALAVFVGFGFTIGAEFARDVWAWLGADEGES